MVYNSLEVIYVDVVEVGLGEEVRAEEGLRISQRMKNLRVNQKKRNLKMQNQRKMDRHFICLMPPLHPL